MYVIKLLEQAKTSKGMIQMLNNHETIELLIKDQFPEADTIDPRLIEYVAIMVDEEDAVKGSEQLAVEKLLYDMYKFFTMNL